MHPDPASDPHRPTPHAPGAEAKARAHSPHPPDEGDEPLWHGITWRDVPGHDRASQKLNFSLLKRGLLRRHEECHHLEGAALKLRLQQLSDRNRKNSRNRTGTLPLEEKRPRLREPGRRHLPPPPSPGSAASPGAHLPPQTPPATAAWPAGHTPGSPGRSGPS